VFLTLHATAWDKGRLRIRLLPAFSELEDRYLFDSTVDPSDLKTITGWKVAKAKLSD
jgi:hypothetical protein